MPLSLRKPSSLVVILCAVLCLAYGASAQNSRNTDYNPDKSLKSNARVNPSTLAMELSIPVGGYPGRGGGGLPVSFTYSSKVWQFRHSGIYNSLLFGEENLITAVFAKHSAAGWTSSLASPRIDFSYDIYRGKDQGVEYEGQIYTYGIDDPNQVGYPLYQMKRLRVIMPDGSAHEFRAGDLPVQVGTTTGGTTALSTSGTYLSVDGSRMRLEMGASPSTLYMPDGGRYTFAPTGYPYYQVVADTYTDRNGNRTAYSSSTNTWTDSLGRSVHDPMPGNWTNTQLQTVGDVTEQFSGMGSNTIPVTFSWRYLKDPNGGESGLGDANQQLGYLSDRYCNVNSFTMISGTHLFDQGGDVMTRVCAPGSPSNGPPFNPVVLTKITLANGQSYRFEYNLYGEIEKIIYPTGGYERFAYGTMPPVQVSNKSNDQANRGVTDRWVSASGDGTDEIHWTYGAVHGTWQSPAPYKVTTTAPDGTRTERLLYDEPDERFPRFYGFDRVTTGLSYEDRSYSAAGQMLRRHLTKYDYTAVPTGVYPQSSGLTADRDVRPVKEVSIIFEPGAASALATMTETVYDANADAAYFASLNPKQVKTYNYKVIDLTTAQTGNIDTISALFTSSDLAATAETDYLYDANYKARNITGLATETRIRDASGNMQAKTHVYYDEGAYPVISAGTDAHWVDPSTAYRGNATTTRSWTDITNNLYVDAQAQYDNFGNLRKAWDGKGNLTQTDYSATYNCAYPTGVTTPVPDPSGVNGSNTAFTTSTVYDFDTGLPTSTTDANGQTTSMEYDDPLLRPTKVTAPNGAETVTEYGAGTSAATRYVKVSTQIDATDWKVGYSWYDGLGRTIKSQSVDAAAGDVFADTEYDNMGRVKRTTNPYRTGDTIYWTTPAYDDLGRTITVTTPDNAVVSTAYSLATTGSQDRDRRDGNRPGREAAEEHHERTRPVDQSGRAGRRRSARQHRHAQSSDLLRLRHAEQPDDGHAGCPDENVHV